MACSFSFRSLRFSWIQSILEWWRYRSFNFYADLQLRQCEYINLHRNSGNYRSLLSVFCVCIQLGSRKPTISNCDHYCSDSSSIAKPSCEIWVCPDSDTFHLDSALQWWKSHNRLQSAVKRRVWLCVHLNSDYWSFNSFLLCIGSHDRNLIRIQGRCVQLSGRLDCFFIYSSYLWCAARTPGYAQ